MARRPLQGPSRMSHPSPVPARCPAVTLARSGLRVSRIGLGLASVHLVRPDRRAALVDTALALGITHFDTAAFYGDGLSERILGRALAGRRGQVTITTKFGLLPTRAIAAMGPLAPVGRKARGALRRLGLVRYPRRDYAVSTLTRSFAASLRALRTDHVDVLAIHEPDATTGIDDDVIEALCALKRAGAARLIGVAGDDVAAVVARWGDVLDIVQTAENGGRTGRRAPDFTYGLFSHGVGRGDPPLSQDAVDGRLAAALARRPDGAVLVQTRDPQRLHGFVGLAAA